ncbi:reductive dehalogenase [bacterium]|nr:reductive dehalogenase [bacterium]
MTAESCFIIIIYAAIVVFSGAALLFIMTSLRERRKRPALLAAALYIPAAAVALFLAAHPEPVYRWPVAGMVLAGLLAVLVLFLPFGTVAGLSVPGSRKRIDERDAIFHRFYRLKPGTGEFREFYRAHPELESVDEKIRAMPHIDEPGTVTYNAKTTPFSSSLFAVMDRIFRDERLDETDSSEEPVRSDPEENTRRIKGFSLYSGADLVGVGPLDPANVYTHIGRSPGKWGSPVTCDHPHAVVLAVEMDYSMVRHAPHHIATTESSFKYFKVGNAALAVTSYIRSLGYSARPHVDGNYRVLCPPVAVDAGLGELGRLGLLITPEYGPRVRLAVVTTDMPLFHDNPREFGVQDFCEFCRKCAVNCPSGAIQRHGKQLINGVEKWQSSQEACFSYWRRVGSDCSICLKVCPYSHPGSLLHNLMRIAVRRNPAARRIALHMDDFFYGRRPKNRYPLPEWHR